MHFSLLVALFAFRQHCLPQNSKNSKLYNALILSFLLQAMAYSFGAAEETGYFDWLPDMLQKKRDGLVEVLNEIGCPPVFNPEGGYFVCADGSTMMQVAGIDPDDPTVTPDSPLEDRPDVRLCKWLTEKVGVTAIPVSPFYLPEDRAEANTMMRFAFCKDEAVMTLAMQRLSDWQARCKA